MWDSEPRTIVITGGASGVGLDTCKALRAIGHTVATVDHLESDVQADLATESGRRSAAKKLARLFPNGIDAVITCAAVSGPNDAPSLISAVNYFGTTRLISGLHRSLELGHHSRVVVLSSSPASLLPFDPELLALYLNDDEEGARSHSADALNTYITGKRALCQWVRRISALSEWGGSGILVNAIAPGITPDSQPSDAANSPARRETDTDLVLVADHSYRNSISPVPLIMFLASAANTNMVGQVIYSDGGREVTIRGDSEPLIDMQSVQERYAVHT